MQTGDQRHARPNLRSPGIYCTYDWMGIGAGILPQGKCCSQRDSNSGLSSPVICRNYVMSYQAKCLLVE